MLHRRSAAIFWGVLVLAGFLGVAAVLAVSATTGVVRTGGQGGPADVAAEVVPSPTPRFSTTIVGASEAPGIPTGEVDVLGKPVLANCTTCHATREANLTTREGRQLQEFHQGLTTTHGEQQCVACHNPGDYSQLRLASGEAIEFTDSLRLCRQCHGPQYRDYEQGAHGGMTGYWDLSRGPRTRNHCLACHDAHAPQYQSVMPVFRPRDLPPRSHREDHP